MTVPLRGEPMLHPVTLSSLVLLLVNDHWAKAAFGNAVTGKLSDLAGVVLLAAMFMHIGVRRVVAATLTGVGFALVKVVPVVNGWWNDGYVLVYDLLGLGVPGATRTDPTDLLALGALALLWLVPERGRPAASGAPRSPP